MAGRLWIAALLIAVTMACGEAVAPAPPVPVQESVVVVPAAQNDPDVLPYLLSLNNEVGSASFYSGVQSLESNILESDVIARVSYLSKRSSSVLRPGQYSYAWTAMLEFRFTVHEYLKGTGPAEIGGIVYMWFETEAQARLAAARIGAAHDSRWDSREAIVFLYSPSKEAVQTVHYMHWGAALPTTSDQYLFGRVIDLSDRYSGEAYSVASAHRKLWLPAAETPSQGASGSSNNNAQSPDDKLFLLDAPAHAGGVSGAVRVTLPTISQGSIKSKITALEAEANRGGTPEYRKCVETSYRYENNLRYSAEFEGPFPHIRQTSDIGSGLPAGTLVRDIVDNEGTSVDKIGLSWFKGPDKDLVTDVNVDFTPWGGSRVRYTRRVVTTRPLPAGEYAPNPGGTWHGGVVCARYPAIADNYWVIEITVTAPAGVLHEAFFDPVAIGSAVGRRRHERRHQARRLRAEWHEHDHLQPEVGVRHGYYDAGPLDVAGGTRRRLHRARRLRVAHPVVRRRHAERRRRADVERGEPALERRRPAHAAHPVRQRDHHAADGHAHTHAHGGAHRYTDRHADPGGDTHAYTDTHGDAYAHADPDAYINAHTYDDRASHRDPHTPRQRSHLLRHRHPMEPRRYVR